MRSYNCCVLIYVSQIFQSEYAMQIESKLNVIESAELKRAVASDLRQKDKSLAELIKESEAKENPDAGFTDDKKAISTDTSNRDS